MSSHVSLTRHLIEEQRAGRINADLRPLIAVVARACTSISIAVGKGALGGVLYAGTQGAADPVSGTSLLLPAFAAAFLGSTSVIPGRFNPWGSLVAVYFLVTGITGLVFLGVSSFVQDMFDGGALVLAVTLSQIVRGREEQQF